MVGVRAESVAGMVAGTREVQTTPVVRIFWSASSRDLVPAVRAFPMVVMGIALDAAVLPGHTRCQKLTSRSLRPIRRRRSRNHFSGIGSVDPST